MFFTNKSDERQGAFLLYERRVRQLTEKTFKNEWIENSQYRGPDYVLDHKVSIKECFDREVPIEVAAHVCNLQIVSKEYNLKKGSKSTMTADELIEEVADRDSGLF